MIPCDLVLLFRSQEKKSKSLTEAARSHTFLNRLSVNSTVKCEWGPKIVQHNFILIFKYNANFCFQNYMVPQKHKGFITYHFLCHGWNCIIGAMYYPLFMLNLPAVSSFLWFSCEFAFLLGEMMPQLGGTVSFGPSHMWIAKCWSIARDPETGSGLCQAEPCGAQEAGCVPMGCSPRWDTAVQCR